MLKVIVVGPRGKMGKLITQIAANREDMELVALFTRRDPETIQTRTGVPVYSIDKAAEMKDDIDVMIPVPKIETRSKPYDKIPLIAYFEPVNSLGFIPQEYVDISEFIEVKRAMCYEHQSQISWMQDNYKDTLGGKDFFDGVETRAKFYGLQCGVDYAEGFRLSNDAFRVVPYRFLP